MFIYARYHRTGGSRWVERLLLFSNRDFYVEGRNLKPKAEALLKQ